MTSNRPTGADEPLYAGLGWILCDEVMLMRGYPQENHKQMARKVFTQAGGPVVRALMQLRRFGAKARLVGAIGNDFAGSLVRDEIQACGIETELTIGDDYSPTRVGHVWLAADTGSRTIAYAPDGPELGSVSFDDILRDARTLLLDGRHASTALDLASFAASKGIPVAIDIGSYKEHMTEFLAVASTIIAPRPTWTTLARGHGYSDPIQMMLSVKKSTCVMTDGSSMVYASEDGRVEECAPSRVLPVDSNGAGDVFFGAFAWAQTHGYPLSAALRFASTAAAIKCTRLGNHELPRLDEVSQQAGL